MMYPSLMTIARFEAANKNFLNYGCMTAIIKPDSALLSYC